MEGDCGYCYQAIHTQDYLECVECEQYIHVKCLKRPGTPGDFSGWDSLIFFYLLGAYLRNRINCFKSFSDVFFTFKCVNCTSNSLESFERQSLPW